MLLAAGCVDRKQTRMKKLLTLVAVTIAATMLLSGCGSTPKKIAYKSLAAVGAAGNSAADAVAEAYAKNKINETQWQNAKVKYSNFQTAYNNACREAGMSLDAPASGTIVTIVNDWIMFADSLVKGTQ